MNTRNSMKTPIKTFHLFVRTSRSTWLHCRYVALEWKSQRRPRGEHECARIISNLKICSNQNIKTFVVCPSTPSSDALTAGSIATAGDDQLAGLAGWLLPACSTDLPARTCTTVKPTDSHSISMSSSSCSSKIPPHLAIDVLYADDSVVVINKPCHLRSVPGHANPPTLGKRKRPSDDIASTTSNAGGDTKSPSNRQTAQEAWMAAIQSFAEESDDESSEDGCCASQTDMLIRSFLKKLSTFAKNGIPRKKKLFVKYASRNSQRLFGGGGTDTQNIEAIADLAFERIKERQIPLLNLPEQTKDEESAEGQLKLLGYEDLRKVMIRADQEHDDEKPNQQLQNQKAIPKEFFSKIRVVHRLDMETSGLLVFARTEEAASKLCEAWRNRDSVEKYYLARCLRWPPLQNEHQEKGEINLPLAPSDERLKWKVVDENEDGAKPSKTLWSVYKAQKLSKESRR